MFSFSVIPIIVFETRRNMSQSSNIPFTVFFSMSLAGVAFWIFSKKFVSLTKLSHDWSTSSIGLKFTEIFLFAALSIVRISMPVPAIVSRIVWKKSSFPRIADDSVLANFLIDIGSSEKNCDILPFLLNALMSAINSESVVSLRSINASISVSLKSSR